MSTEAYHRGLLANGFHLIGSLSDGYVTNDAEAPIMRIGFVYGPGHLNLYFEVSLTFVVPAEFKVLPGKRKPSRHPWVSNGKENPSIKINDSIFTTRRVVKALSILQTSVITTPAKTQTPESTIKIPELNVWAKLMINRSSAYDSQEDLLGEAMQFLGHLTAPDHVKVLKHLKATPTKHGIWIGGDMTGKGCTNGTGSAKRGKWRLWDGCNRNLNKISVSARIKFLFVDKHLPLLHRYDRRHQHHD